MHYPCTAECNHAPKQAWNALRAASVPACLLSTRTCNYQQWRVWIRRMIQPFFKLPAWTRPLSPFWFKKMPAWTRPLSSMFYSTSHFILNDFKSTSALPFRACLANNARSAETPQERGAIRVKAKAGQMRTKCVNEGSEFDGWFNHFLTLPSWTVVSMFSSTSHFILNFKSTSGLRLLLLTTKNTTSTDDDEHPWALAPCGLAHACDCPQRASMRRANRHVTSKIVLGCVTSLSLRARGAAFGGSWRQLLTVRQLVAVLGVCKACGL